MEENPRHKPIGLQIEKMRIRIYIVGLCFLSSVLPCMATSMPPIPVEQKVRGSEHIFISQFVESVEKASEIKNLLESKSEERSEPAGAGQPATTPTDEAMPFVDTPTGETTKGQAWIIVKPPGEGKPQYAVLAKGDAGDWHVYPATIPDDLAPDKTLGRPVFITAKVVEEEVGDGRQTIKRLMVTKIEPVLSGPMETALDRARAKVVEMEKINPALSGFSKTRPQFSQDEKGLVKAVLEFNFNTTPLGKDRIPMAVDKSKPFCYLIVSVWRPNNLPGQPVHTQREYRIGAVKLEGYVTVFCSDDHLAKELRLIFESEMEKAESKTTSEMTLAIPTSHVTDKIRVVIPTGWEVGQQAGTPNITVTRKAAIPPGDLAFKPIPSSPAFGEGSEGHAKTNGIRIWFTLEPVGACSAAEYKQRKVRNAEIQAQLEPLRKKIEQIPGTPRAKPSLLSRTPRNAEEKSWLAEYADISSKLQILPTHHFDGTGFLVTLVQSYYGAQIASGSARDEVDVVREAIATVLIPYQAPAKPEMSGISGGE